MRFMVMKAAQQVLRILHPNRKLMTQKGQMKIQQTAFMLIAVTLFFILAGLFVFVLRFSNLKAASKMVEDENAMLLVTKLANSPEFACGHSFGNSKPNCIDGDKIMALKEHLSDYSGFWGVAEIEIRKVYPASGNTLCDSRNLPDCGIIEVYSKNVNKLPASSNFVSLCWKENSDNGIYAKCEIARLIVSGEDKT